MKVGSFTTFSVKIPLLQGIFTPYDPSFYGIFWGHTFCQYGGWEWSELFSAQAIPSQCPDLRMDSWDTSQDDSQVPRLGNHLLPEQTTVSFLPDMCNINKRPGNKSSLQDPDIQGEIIYAPPPLPPFLAKRHFSGEGGGGVYLEAPRGKNFMCPPPFYTPPTPRRVFSGVGGGGV